MDGLMRFPKGRPVAIPRLGGPGINPQLGGSPPVTSTTGYPWADGDILYAADLNAAFVPATGGTVSGPVQVPLPPDSVADSSYVLRCVMDLTVAQTGPTPPIGVYSALYVDTTVQASVPPNTYAWGVSATMHDYSTGDENNENVGVASSIFKFGSSASFANYNQTIDYTGLVSGHIIGFESDIVANGPEPDTTSWNPGYGSRSFYEFDALAYQPPARQPGTVYAVGAAVQPATPNGFTYVCTVAGTSGATAPVWPVAAGTVVDGTVTWKYGTTIAVQYGRFIGMGGGDPHVQIGAGILAEAAFYDAILEFSYATLVDGGVKNAAIRLGPNMPIDFSANMTAAGQNVRTLSYQSATGLFSYRVANRSVFSIDDLGEVAIGGPPMFGYQLEVLGTNSVGISTGGGTFTTAVRMGTGQHLSFTSTDSAIMYYNTTATQGLTVNYGGVDVAHFDTGGALALKAGLGAFGASVVLTKPVVTGAKGGNAALGSLLAALAAYGLITDSST